MRLKTILICTITGAASWFYFRFYIDPGLIYHVQEPPFLFDSRFFAEFVAYPGGLVWYASAFLTQLLQFPALGAAIITSLLLLTAWQTRVSLSAVGVEGPVAAVAGIVPVLLFFFVVADYRFPLAYLLGYLCSFVCVNAYLLLPFKRRGIRLAVYGAVAAIVYYFSGMGLLPVVLACGLYEVLRKRDVITAMAMAGFAIILPFIAARFFFVISVASAYRDVAGLHTALLAAASYPRPSVPVYCAYAVVPLVSIAMALVPVRPHGEKKTTTGNTTTRPGMPLRTIAGGIVVAVFAATTFLSVDKKTRRNYEVDRLARNGDWGTIVAAVPARRLDEFTILSQMQLFRALYHEHRLLDRLFVYPDGLPGKAFMTITGTMASQFPMQMSDCCFEIGALNLAEFYANEALAFTGKKACLLERLALINAMKGRTRSAKKYITLLAKTPFQGAATRRCERFLAGGSDGAGGAALKRIALYAPVKEYLCTDYYTELVNLLNRNNGNRIAFAYFIAHNLLTNSVGLVVSNVSYFSRLGYRELPVHVQEAAALQLSVVRDTTARVGEYALDKAILSRHSRFNESLQRIDGNRAVSHTDFITEFGSTYWFYLVRSGRPVLVQPGEG